jgi:hypothetical protein
MKFLTYLGGFAAIVIVSIVIVVAGAGYAVYVAIRKGKIHE